MLAGTTSQGRPQAILDKQFVLIAVILSHSRRKSNILFPRTPGLQTCKILLVPSQAGVFGQELLTDRELPKLDIVDRTIRTGNTGSAG